MANPQDDLDALTQSYRDEQIRQLQTDVQSAPAPDAMAQQTRTAQQLGMQPHEVEGLMPQATAALRAKNMAAVAQAHPAVASWATQNPRQAVAASDDHTVLDRLGSAWNAFATWASPKPAAPVSPDAKAYRDQLVAYSNPLGSFINWLTGSKGSDLSNSFKASVLSTTGSAIRGAGDLAGAVIGPTQSGAPVLSGARDIGRQMSAAGREFAASVQNPNLATKAVSLAGGVLPFAASGPLAPLTMGLAGAGEEGAEAERLGKDGTPGARAAIVGNAVYQATLGKVMEVASPLLGKYAAPVVGDLVGNSIARLTGGTIAGNYAGQAAAEGGEALANYAARAVSAATMGALMAGGSNAIERATINPNKPLTEGLGQSALDMVALDLVTHGLHAAIGAFGPGEVDQAKATQVARSLLPDAARVVQGLRDATVLDVIDRAGQMSKFKERDPEGYKALQAVLADHAGVSDIMVDPKAVRAYQQSDGYDRFNDPFLAHEDAISQAETSGGDAALPVDFVTGELAGTDAFRAIRDHIKLRPDGLTGAEARELAEGLADRAKAQFDKLNEADTAAAKDAETRAALIERRTREFQNAGFTPRIANIYAQVEVQRAATRAARMGRDLQEGDITTRVVRNLPETLAAARKADRLDLVINAMRQNKPAETQQGKTLLEWIAARGGINDSGGDLKAMGLDRWHLNENGKRPVPIRGRRKIIRDYDPRQTAMGGLSGEGDYGHDTTLRSAVEAGYFPELEHVEPTQLDVNDLHAAIADELAGRPRYAEAPKVDDVRLAADDLRQMIADQGRDPEGMTDREIRKFVEEHARFEPGDGRALNQEARGRILLTPDGPATIELFKSANLSTVVHEFGHQWLEELRADAEHPEASDQIKADWATVQNWFARNGHPIGEDGEIPTDAHELFARGIERYFMEGKAPSPALTGIFEKVKGWLVNIYRTVAGLNSPITPELREVFDRLLATDDEINQARNTLAMNVDPAALKALGMSDAEAKVYDKLVNAARDEANAELLAKTMASIRAKHEAAWQVERREVRSDEAARLEETPLFNALRLARETPLDRRWIADRMGEDALGLLPDRKGALAREGGAHPDDVAEMAGYQSGEQMIEALIGAEQANREAKAAGDKRSLRARIIDQAADAEMERRHGKDPFNDGSIEDEAIAAVNNELAGKVLEAELKVLGRASGNTAALNSLARQWARDKVRNGTIAAEALPAAIQRHTRAMAKAGREAEKAILAKKYDEAFNAKQRQMMASALLTEAKAAQDEVTRGQDALAKIAKRQTMKSVDQDYLDQAHALLDLVQLGPRSQKSIARQGKWEEWAKARAAEGFDVVVPDSFEATVKGTHWTQMAVNDFLALKDAVDQVMHLGRLKQRLLDGQEEREWADIRKEVNAGAAQMRQRPMQTIDQLHGVDLAERLKAGIYSLDAMAKQMETIVDFMDGGDPNGVWNRVFFRPIAEAEARENTMFSEWQRVLKDTFDAVPKEDASRWLDRVQTPWGPVSFEDGSVHDLGTMTRQRLIAMALNTGNEGNFQRLADGYRINRDSIREFLNATLTKGEWEFVQTMWDHINTYWPELSAMERRVNGVAPDKVEALAFDTPHGPMRGGYYPAYYDGKINARAANTEAMNQGLRDANFTNASTRADSTKSRSDSVKRPILLDLGVLNRHVSEVIHDITHREAVIQAWRFVNDPTMYGAVKNTLGPQYADMLRPWVKQVANSWAIDRTGNEDIGKIINSARSNMVVVSLGLNAGTVAVHTTMTLMGAGEIGAKWMGHGLWSITREPRAAVRAAVEMSPELQAIGQHYDRSINELVSKIAYRNVADKALSKLQEAAIHARQFAMYGISFIVQRMSAAGWIGAYNKALSEGMEESDARAYAEKIVRRISGGHGAKDMPALMNGAGRYGQAVKLLTAFYTPMKALYQRQSRFAHDLTNMDQRAPRDMPRLAARAFALFIAPVVMGQAIRLGFGAKGPDKDESWEAWWAKKFIADQLGPIPVVSTAFEPIWDHIAGHKGRDPSVSPLQRPLDAVVHSADDIGKQMQGKAPKAPIRDTLETVGYVTGMVPGQIARSAQFLDDVANGSQRPGNMYEFMIGLQTGHVPKKR